MNQELWPWALYDLSGATTPDSQDTMRDHFRRFRERRGKGVSGLTDKEKLRANHSLEALREKICENAWNEDRLCYVHVNEGYRSCESSARPSKEKWEAHIAARPHSWIRKYERSILEKARSTNRGGAGTHSRHHRWSLHVEWRLVRHSVLFGILHDSNHVQQGVVLVRVHQGVAPRSLPREETQAIGRDIDARTRYVSLVEPMMREEDPRAQLYGPRTSRRRQQSPQVVGDHLDDMDRVLVAQDDVNAAVNRTGTQPREMSAGRWARREGRSTYAPLTQPAKHPRES
ncbi:unnamed protein product [Peronospora destructor]|uniref:Uncharacterized protein n=1 Tax=Peronospora destructor TaxID=86335 RepID=A0AAV0TSN6_9STRA|nr:unnamed protein product [Peronospora destructor]